MTTPLPIGRAPVYTYSAGDTISSPQQWHRILPPDRNDADPQSPAWWVHRLYRCLMERQGSIWYYDSYYRGEHPLPWLPQQARDEFRRVLKMSRTNYMGLVVDAKAERLQVEGFRVAGDDGSLPDDADDELWRIWQANDLDSESDQAFLEALIGGCSYLLVAPNPDDPRTPLITVEHASQVIVEYEPGSGRRKAAAALKVWQDDWTGGLMATLYLPNRLYKVRSARPVTLQDARGPEWVPRTDRDSEGAGNPLGVVPVTELPVTPRMLTGGRSYLSDLTDIQDRINKTVADRLITQDFGAFPQKWASGWPAEDEDGAAQPQIDIGRDRMITTDVPSNQVAFGQFDAAPLDPYSAAKREDIMDIAARSRTPAQDLLVTMSNVNGDTLKASQAGHVAVVRQMSRHFGEGLERAMRLAQRVAGVPVAMAMETMWANPEYRTEGELTDAVVKRTASGLSSIRQGREDLGYSATQIKRLEADDEEASRRASLGDLSALFPPMADANAPVRAADKPWHTGQDGVALNKPAVVAANPSPPKP